VALVGGLLLVRRLLGAGERRHVTWGCGYGGVGPRMQYTGASFSAPFVEVTGPLLPHLTRARLPGRDDLFPGPGHHLNTHCVDAVERRLFRTLGEGEATANELMARLPEDARASFALGLVTLVAIVALVLSTAGGAP
jgi:hydrogenase-4 component B